MAANPPDVERALRIARAMFAGDPRVTAIDYGYAYRGGERTKDLVIRIHVTEKLAREQCKSREFVPARIAGIPTDVLARRYRNSGGGEASGASAVRPGISVGNPKARAGTLGLIVFDGTQLAILSCHHVLAGSDGAEGDVILCPAVERGGTVADDIVARLHRTYYPSGWGDAAVALIDANRPVRRDCIVSNVTVSAVGEASAGLELEKIGATTVRTRGLVEGTGSYRVEPWGYVVDGFQLGPAPGSPSPGGNLSLQGDSGAVWYDPVSATGFGMHVASGHEADGHPYAVACGLISVIETLQVTLEPVR